MSGDRTNTQNAHSISINMASIETGGSHHGFDILISLFQSTFDEISPQLLLLLGGRQWVGDLIGSVEALYRPVDILFEDMKDGVVILHDGETLMVPGLLEYRICPLEVFFSKVELPCPHGDIGKIGEYHRLTVSASGIFCISSRPDPILLGIFMMIIDEMGISPIIMHDGKKDGQSKRVEGGYGRSILLEGLFPISR